MKKPYPLLVGVTGGIGSGKSTVCSLFAELGCELFEADRVAKDLQLQDPEIIEGIKKLFGSGVYSTDKENHLQLDRKAIAGEVFSNPEKLRALNSLIHPKVFDAFSRSIEYCMQRRCEVLVKEAAILFEAGKDKELDRIIVVAAGNELRISRAIGKGMGTREEILKRMASQWPQEKLIERADYVIFNDGTVDELRAQVREVYRKLVEYSSAGRES
jgi:dephospho-CoA kinase